MIQLYNNYVILNDDLQWILAKDTGHIDKRNGRIKYDPAGYFSGLRNALDEFRRRNIRTRCKNESLALRDALAAIREEDARLEEFIRENIPDA